MEKWMWKFYLARYTWSIKKYWYYCWIIKKSFHESKIKESIANFTGSGNRRSTTSTTLTGFGTVRLLSFSRAGETVIRKCDEELNFLGSIMNKFHDSIWEGHKIELRKRILHQGLKVIILLYTISFTFNNIFAFTRIFRNRY